MCWWRSSGTFLLFFGRPRLRRLLASIFNFQDTLQQTPSLDCKQQLSSRPPKNCDRRAGRAYEFLTPFGLGRVRRQNREVLQDSLRDPATLDSTRPSMTDYNFAEQY